MWGGLKTLHCRSIGAGHISLAPAGCSLTEKPSWVRQTSWKLQSYKGEEFLGMVVSHADISHMIFI